MEKVIQIIKESNNLIVKALIIYSGNDMNLIITGGDKPHIGTIALGIPSEYGGIVSTNTVAGHKETELAFKAAKKISEKRKIVVSVSCGIHKDNISLEEIHIFENLTNEIINELMEE